ncbi:MAG TPA: hypothetical protein VHV30_04770, partial [Polyangiaceae bacterium]|nr:hypothetical protein [Polyangiaceae bacterium]
APADREVPWRPAIMVRIGRTVLALDEPVARALAEIEHAPDEATNEAPPPPPEPVVAAPAGTPASEGGVEDRGAAAVAEVELVEALAKSEKKRPRSGWSVTDLFVMAAAIGVLALSLAGLVWLLRG